MQHNSIIKLSFDWGEFIGGIFGGSAVATLVRETFNYIKKKKGNVVDLAENTKDIADIHRIMQNVVDTTFCNRFMVFVGEDSAGILAAGKNLFITAQYEKLAAEENVKPIIDEIQRWKADTPYYDIFSEMLSAGMVKLKTSEMGPSKLRDIYESQGVKMSKVFHLMTTKNHSKVFYCSIASTVREELSADDRVIIYSAVDKLSNIFNKHKKFY
jgi:hypothetical protein